MVCSMAAVYEGRQETDNYRMERFDKIDCSGWQYEKGQNRDNRREAKVYEMNQARERFAHAHPCLSFVFTLVGMPALMVGTVLGSATAILFPIGLLMGWL